MNKTYKFIILIVLISIHNVSIAQQDTNVVKLKDLNDVIVTPYEKEITNDQLRLLKRAYPLALQTKTIIKELDNNLALEAKKRKQNKLVRTQKKELKTDFTYTLKDLYVSEGKMYLKLIHRETGMTLYEILRKYQGSFKANAVHLSLKLFGHDSKSTFDPNGKDKDTERILREIERGSIPFDKRVVIIDKNEFKKGMKSYKENKRSVRKRIKENKKASKKK